jgi:hypothetical protein
MTLVDAGGPAEVGASALGGEGTFVFAREGGSVVSQVGNGVFPDVEFLGHNVDPCQHGCLLDVAVGEVPIGVAGRHYAGLDVGREGFAPDDGALVSHKDDTTETRFGSVHGLDDRWFFWDELGQAGRTVTQVLR